jgi:hypothetical protein
MGGENRGNLAENVWAFILLINYFSCHDHVILFSRASAALAGHPKKMSVDNSSKPFYNLRHSRKRIRPIRKKRREKESKKGI